MAAPIRNPFPIKTKKNLLIKILQNTKKAPTILNKKGL